MERNSPETNATLRSYFARYREVVVQKPKSIKADELPLARIKRIMKQDSCDPHPRMISADGVPYMAFAAQCFIGVITELAWKTSTTNCKRNTLQVKDLKAAVYSSSHFDFLIDVIDAFDEQVESEKEMKQMAAHVSLPFPGQGVVDPPGCDHDTTIIGAL